MENIFKDERIDIINKKEDKKGMFPFTNREKKKQRAWGGVFSLGGVLLVAIGLSSNIPSIFLGINLLTLIGIIVFILGLIYIINILD